MKFTAAQLKHLRASQAFRIRPPTIGWFFRRAWWLYALLLLLCGSGGALAATHDYPVICGIFVGVFFAVILRDFGIFRRYVQGWVLSIEIIDWARVEQILKDHEPPVAP